MKNAVLTQKEDHKQTDKRSMEATEKCHASEKLWEKSITNILKYIRKVKLLHPWINRRCNPRKGTSREQERILKTLKYEAEVKNAMENLEDGVNELSQRVGGRRDGWACNTKE